MNVPVYMVGWGIVWVSGYDARENRSGKDQEKMGRVLATYIFTGGLYEGNKEAMFVMRDVGGGLTEERKTEMAVPRFDIRIHFEEKGTANK